MKEFIAHYRVIYADTDAMGIVYHSNYLHFFEIGRTEFLREIDFCYKNLEAADIMLPLTEVHLKYKYPAKYDDLLEIRTTIEELRNVTVTMHYDIYNQNGEFLVAGTTKHAVTNSELRPVALKKQSKKLYETLQQIMKAKK